MSSTSTQLTVQVHGSVVRQHPEDLLGVLGHTADVHLALHPLLALLLLGGFGEHDVRGVLSHGADQLAGDGASHRRQPGPRCPLQPRACISWCFFRVPVSEKSLLHT